MDCCWDATGRGESAELGYCVAISSRVADVTEEGRSCNVIHA